MNKGMTRTALRRWGLYCWTLLKWTVDAAAIGVVCGVIGTLFHFGVHEVTAFPGGAPMGAVLPACGGTGHCGLL